MQNKPLPQNIDQEMVLLGAMLLNPKIKPKVKQMLTSDDFYREAHQYIFQALCETESDLIAVADYLRSRLTLDKSGGQEYLSKIAAETNTSAGYLYHCEQIKILSQRRRLIHQCAQTANRAWDLTCDISDAFGEHKAGLRVIQQDQKPDFTPNISLVKAVFKDMEERRERGDSLVGIPTGFENIDAHLFGLEPSTYNILMARPSIGKTALALNIADNISKLKRGKVLFFSLESNDKALTRRRMASKSGVYLSRIRTGNIEDSQWPDLVEAADKLSDDSLIILDRPKFKSIEILCAMAETLALEYPISLIVIDHLQKLRTRSNTQSRHHEMSYISDSIASLGKELKVPLLVLSQLNREVEKRGKWNQRPKLNDLKESGDIEQDVDVAIGLYRDTKEAEYAQIEGLKGRDVGTWREWLKFDRFTQTFYDCPNMDDTYSAKTERSFNG